MKTLLAFALATTEQVNATDYVLIHSSDLAKDDKMNNTVIALVFKELKRSDSLTVTDGSGKLVARFEIPASLKYDSQSKRRNILRRPLAEYLAWYGKAERNGSYRVDIPVALENLSEFSDKGQPTHVLVYGDIVHDRGRHPFAYKDKEGKLVWQYPNDAMLQLGDECTWGTKDRKKSLQSLKLHVLYPSSLELDTDYARHLKKFYTKWISSQAGELHCFTNDSKRAVAAWFDPKTRAYSHELDVSCKKAAMVKFKPAGSAVKKPLEVFQMRKAGDVRAVGAKASRIAKEVMMSLSANAAKGEISVAFGWDAPVDFDLVVFIDDNPRPLYFANRKADQGRYLRDKLTSSGIKYEEVVLTKEPRKIEVWANLHGVNDVLKAPPKGEYVIAVDGVVYFGEFVFTVKRGDAGKYMQSRHQSPFWVRIPADCIRPPKSPKAK